MEAPMANKSNNRTLIMDAVAKIITNDGYGSVSMSQVAKLTGLSVATAYNYFTNKQDMIITTYHEACERLNQYIIDHVSKNGAPDVKLASYMHAIYDFSKIQPTTFLFTNSIFNSPINREISQSDQWIDSIMQPWIKIARDGIQQDYFRQMDPLTLIYLAYSNVSCFIVDTFNHNISPDSTSIDEIIIIFLNGIRNPKYINNH